jgi:hypothetical protein
LASKIPNDKSQISNNIEIPNPNVLNCLEFGSLELGIYLEIGNWDLEFLH